LIQGAGAQEGLLVECGWCHFCIEDFCEQLYEISVKIQKD